MQLNSPSVTPRALLDLEIPAVAYQRSEVIFSPGDASDSVMYIQSGGVKLSTVSKSGREAVVALLGPGDFFGEACLTDQRVRMRNATAITPSKILVLTKDQMIRLLRRRPVSDRFLGHVLARHISLEQDLIDQFFSSVEKRLARTLLRLARYGKHDEPQRVLRRMSEQTLARMVGTTRERISALMARFERAGFIEYKGGLAINRSLLSVVLHD